MANREAIRADLERALMIEAGYRCAVPTCRTVAPLEIDHIEDYANVGEHEFANMIVLCANCHRMKGSGPRRLDRKALRIIKSNLALVNQRYNDTERRILEHFVENPDAEGVLLPETPVLFGYLLKDGLIRGQERDTGLKTALSVLTADNQTHFITRGYELTEDGVVFVRNIRENRQVENG